MEEEKKMRLGPQPTPDDYRIFRGSPSEFFKNVADDLKRHEEEEVIKRR